jgi:hypothetical protein
LIGVVHTSYIILEISHGGLPPSLGFLGDAVAAMNSFGAMGILEVAQWLTDGAWQTH